MNKRVKKLWIKALTSGKYKQTEGKLKKRQAFCCLGVLCDIYRKEVKKINSKSFWVKLRYPKPQVLSEEVCDWAGLESQNPTVKNHMNQTLADLNDVYGYSFDKIAEVIKKKL